MPTCVSVTSLMFCAQTVGNPLIIPEPIVMPVMPAAPLSKRRRLTRLDGGSPAPKDGRILSLMDFASAKRRRLLIDLQPAFVVANLLSSSRLSQAAGFLAGAVPDLQAEIIFFSTPTPAATARSYSSGTVAES